MWEGLLQRIRPFINQLAAQGLRVYLEEDGIFLAQEIALTDLRNLFRGTAMDESLVIEGWGDDLATALGELPFVSGGEMIDHLHDRRHYKSYNEQSTLGIL